MTQLNIKHHISIIGDGMSELPFDARRQLDILVWHEARLAPNRSLPPVNRQSLQQLNYITLLESQLSLCPSMKIKLPYCFLIKYISYLCNDKIIQQSFYYNFLQQTFNNTFTYTNMHT